MNAISFEELFNQITTNAYIGQGRLLPRLHITYWIRPSIWQWPFPWMEFPGMVQRYPS